ncbi:MAG: hypothetical protein HY400_06940, partial [Elusimicrobia bacterium]|nr:hypothetical protein [Elusimicrobiota bacterium]
AMVVAHELAHQWFGDYVTMKWWEDVWLNEAFASYMATVAVQDFLHSDYALLRTVTTTWEDYFRQEDGPRSHPIVSKELPTPEDAFDNTNYDKGEQVLRMLDFYIGREAFRRGLKDYLTRFALENATYQDFFAAMEAASGQNLQPFVNSWLLRRGYPLLAIEQRWDARKKSMFLSWNQRPNHKEDGTIFNFKVPVSFHHVHAPALDAVQTIHIHSKEGTLEIPLQDKPEWTTWNVGGVVLAKIQRAGISEREWSLQALHDPDPLARVAALFELAQPWIDREAKTLNPLSSIASRAMNQALSQDPSPYVRAALLSKFLDAKWARFPDSLSETLLAQARAPSGIPDSDDLGKLWIRTKALMLLGKTDYAPGREYVESVLADGNAGWDMVSAAAIGVARYSDEKAIQTLRAALEKQGSRGYSFRKAVLLAFGSVENVGVTADLRGILDSQDANNEVMTGIILRLHNNQTLKNSPEGAGFIKDFVIQSNRYSDVLKARALEVLEEAREPAVRPVLEEIVHQSSSHRLRELAQKILEKNFSSPAVQ